MHWSVAIAVLGATLGLSADPEVTKVDEGHELSWVALDALGLLSSELKSSIPTPNEEGGPIENQESQQPPMVSALARKVVDVRKVMGELASWEDEYKVLAHQLADAIGKTLQYAVETKQVFRMSKKKALCLLLGENTSALLPVVVVNGEYRVQVNEIPIQVEEAPRVISWTILSPASDGNWFSKNKDRTEPSASPGFGLYAPKGTQKPFGESFKWEIETQLRAADDGASIGGRTARVKYPFLAATQKAEGEPDSANTNTWETDVKALAAVLSLWTLTIKAGREIDPRRTVLEDWSGGDGVIRYAPLLSMYESTSPNQLSYYGGNPQDSKAICTIQQHSSSIQRTHIGSRVTPRVVYPVPSPIMRGGNIQRIHAAASIQDDGNFWTSGMTPSSPRGQ